MNKELYSRTTTLQLHQNLPDYLRTDEVYAAMKRLEVPINELIIKHAAHQSVEFAKWVGDNCERLSNGNWINDYIGNMTEYTTEALYQYWHQNIYLKEQGV